MCPRCIALVDVESRNTLCCNRLYGRIRIFGNLFTLLFLTGLGCRADLIHLKLKLLSRIDHCVIHLEG